MQNVDSLGYYTVQKYCQNFNTVGRSQERYRQTDESLSTVFYRHAIVLTIAASLAVSEILSVNLWHDIEIWVGSLSRSLKMAPIDRS